VYCQLTIPNLHHAFTPQTLIMQWDSILVDAIGMKRYSYVRNQYHTYIFFCFSKRMARAFTASCAGPGLVLLICSLYLTSSASSFFIFSSTVSPLLFICKKKKTTPGTENVCESQNGLHLHPTHPNLLPVPQETGFFAGAHTHTKLKRETGLTRSVASSTVGPGVLSFFTPKTRFIATNRTSSTTTVHTNSICHKKTTFQLQPPGTNDSLETKNIPRDPVYCRWHTTQEMPKWVSSQARAIRVNGD